MVEQILRAVATLVLIVPVGLVLFALAKAAARIARAIRRRIQSWRDLRALRPYADELWPGREYEQIRRGES